jgi:glycosyltransferase involved in cell wall biosynthesis
MASAGRILFVTEKFPHPVDDGGQIRSFHVLARLAAEFPVTLLSLAAPSSADVEAIRRLDVEVVECGPRRAGWTVPWFAAEALFTRAPYPMRKNFSRALLAEIRGRLAAGGVRAIHWNHLDAAQYFEHLEGERERVRTVFDTHNLLTRMYERFASTAVNPLRRAYTTLQWWRMSRFEPAILRAVDQVLVCSDLERELVHTWGVKGARIVPNGVDVASFAPARGAARTAGAAPTIVFTGAFSYAPNAEGARWLLDAVRPELAKLLPHARIVLVGKDPSPALRARARPGAIEVTGRVDDVRPYLGEAHVCVVPLRVGGGTRIKILEAMAAGVPVVSTRVGAEGIAARDGESIVLADDAAGFARAVAELAGSPARARAIATAAAALVAERYDWSRVVEPLIDWYRDA